MKRIFKLAGLVLIGLLAALVLVFAAFYARVEFKRGSRVDVTVTGFSIPTDSASITEGQRLVQVKACADCHGSGLSGKTFIDVPPLGKFSGPNLTSGKGSAVANYKDEDWIRAIRYGLGPDHRPLIFMPAGDFHGISNEDLGKMIAYLKSLPAVDQETPNQVVGPMARVLYNLGQLPLLFPYEEVDFNDTPIERVDAGPTIEYGRYLSSACTGCHGAGFSGGHVPGTPPSWPNARNLTPSGRFADWSFDDFKTALTQGLTPDGHQIDPQFMPWKSTQAMTDIELEALYKFLKQLPAKTEGTR